MDKIPTVNCMRVTSQDDRVTGGEVYVFHHVADDANCSRLYCEPTSTLPQRTLNRFEGMKHVDC
jgi:hypothetical protein